jgi:hypothetical protein
MTISIDNIASRSRWIGPPQRGGGGGDGYMSLLWADIYGYYPGVTHYWWNPFTDFQWGEWVTVESWEDIEFSSSASATGGDVADAIHEGYTRAGANGTYRPVLDGVYTELTDVYWETGPYVHRWHTGGLATNVMFCTDEGMRYFWQWLIAEGAASEPDGMAAFKAEVTARYWPPWREATGPGPVIPYANRSKIRYGPPDRKLMTEHAHG